MTTQEQTLKVQLVKSPIGTKESHRATVRGLGLRKLNSVSELQDLGLARVSYGSGFLKAAISGARRLAQEIQSHGTVNLLKDGMQTPDINALLSKK